MQTTPLAIFFEARQRHWLLTGRTPAGGIRQITLATSRDPWNSTPEDVLAAAKDAIKANGWKSVRWEQRSGDAAAFSFLPKSTARKAA